MSIILNRVGAIFIPVSNIEKARDWYCDLLEIPNDQEILYGHLYILPMEGVRIVLDSKIYHEEHVFKKPAFHLNTNDIEAAYEYMKRKNIRLLTEIENNHWFNFQDPDGNTLMICKC
ncbi:glyoxalase [Alkalihalobacillus alcalophilus ATCC 27647 = CGMCC 1.3604]|uniref:Glyoxalase n=1 Tax=Alkalihalobacillus alcalophilus ATCC 27647 = CGMCC 1.3604 TaxID=1218173 RepID=A0A094WPM7_ALKAL|nr:VOC family protein [Alkalihalobacillus alcalophilus]KGA97983.1 glyoxalase [Alkalihalobacillus alcalophilus ATCC 27647 = CGMCC 1.3604]MED1563986.1 VOC family protein [Alkalihalobacillus alcalophilus]THG89629.1 glyoxalase [Alkalihalobacillus alcalophilus ATCC 27647 = CGMCC 1.3604]